MKTLAVFTKLSYSEEKFICTVNEEEIDSVIEQVTKDFNSSYGEESVTVTIEDISVELLEEEPLVNKLLKIVVDDEGERSTSWIVFKKCGYKERLENNQGRFIWP